jgi:hypothetical protein
MKRRTRLLLLLSAALVVALSYLAGALAPPVRGVSAAASSAAPALTAQQWAGVEAAISLLLSGSEDQGLYLPLMRR